jgi:hypothetical protein
VLKLILSFILALGLTAAANPGAARAATSRPAAPKSDSQIEAAINARLAKSKIAADHFKVRVQGGVAYWEGTTDVVQHKGAATRMAKSAGARSVVNRIQISEAARAKAASNLASGRRRVQVKRGEPRSEPHAR